MYRYWLIAFLLIAPLFSSAQELIVDKSELIKSRVVEVSATETRKLSGTDVTGEFQIVTAVFLEGSQSGREVTFENDFIQLAEGDIFYLLRSVHGFEGTETFAVSEPYRMPAILLFSSLFVVAVLVIGGKQGLRGLVALAGSLALIGYMLLPGILAGYSPVLISIVVSSLIIILGSYITHGFNRTTTTAVLGMVTTILFVGALSYFAIGYAKLSGFGSEEAVYLNFNTRGSIDFAGLLLGGILIGLLGVLYDAAISQSIAIEELARIAPHVSRKAIYVRALRIGREHIGALVDTLAIAYVGVSLPHILLFYVSDTSGFAATINTEHFATEIIRTMIGSIGLVLAVPITTLIATIMLVPKHGSVSPETIRKEEELLKHAGHSH